MAFTTEQVLSMIDSSGESDIDEYPCFLLPHESDSEGEEPHSSNSSTTIPTIQTGAIENSDSSDEECVSPGKIWIFQTIY